MKYILLILLFVLHSCNANPVNKGTKILIKITSNGKPLENERVALSYVSSADVKSYQTDNKGVVTIPIKDIRFHSLIFYKKEVPKTVMRMHFVKDNKLIEQIELNYDKLPRRPSVSKDGPYGEKSKK